MSRNTKTSGKKRENGMIIDENAVIEAVKKSSSKAQESDFK
jgi:hypothetical protein